MGAGTQFIEIAFTLSRIGVSLMISSFSMELKMKFTDQCPMTVHGCVSVPVYSWVSTEWRAFFLMDVCYGLMATLARVVGSR